MANKKTLSAALKKRLRNDKENLLSPEDWEKDAWLDLNIGLFYDSDDEFVDDVVYEVTRDVLRNENKKLKRNARLRLGEDVNIDTKCKAAVEEMLDASLSTEPIAMRP